MLLLGLVPAVVASPVKRAGNPTVTIAYPTATIVGASSNNVDSFHGIPFAQQPTGSLRLKPPLALQSALGTVQATGVPRACPQFFLTTNANDFPAGVLGDLLDTPLFQTVTDSGEDCLNLNVLRPAGTTESSKLPVIFWIYGGAFELGSTQTYDGTSIVANSISIGKPVVFVAVNYRVGGFGFLPGKEVKADGASNLGLLDQRLGLQWVADNIAAFGGDASKVTIWGESAGSISALDQMIMYNGNNTYKGQPLFRAAIMDSGSVIPANPVDGRAGQAVYDAVVENAGCASSSDTLECLRGVDYATFLNAANSVPGAVSYNSVALSYLPRPDGTTFSDSPDILVKNGQYAKVPFIIGDQEDEGTLFALFQPNLTTTEDLVTYFHTIYFPDIDVTVIRDLINVYPDDPTQGSPFRTGILNNWYPQYKRLAAILGDITFTLTRRAFLSIASEVNPDVPSWSYLSSYDYGTPILGTLHGSDIVQVFYGLSPNYAASSIRSYYLSFVRDLDPNSNSGYPNWPQWSKNHQLMNFFSLTSDVINDDFRSDQYNFLVAHMESFRI